MSDHWLHQASVSVSRKHGVARRDFLRNVSAGALTAGMLTWTDVLNLQAAELRKRGMACILLWMQGGPSQFETFSPKPDHANGGETGAIKTSVPGIHISENLPEVAQVMDRLCVIRSMTGREGSHPRASYLMHTGYLPTAAIKYPSLGSNISHQLGEVDVDLPNFVQIGNGRRAAGGYDAGFLGVDFDPFVVSNPTRVPDNTAITTGRSRYRKRLKLLDRLQEDFGKSGGNDIVEDHKKLYKQASKMILSPNMKTFDISSEQETVQAAYGESNFGAGCLLARRLVEAGVTFVEVNLGNWDTHQDNGDRSRELCEQLDRPYAQLIRDLDERGMLDRTLVVWMGEFGRTPRINARAGRDHYPRAFNVALAGGGVNGGQVIGKTDAGGNAITDRPVQVEDLFCTIFQAMGVDPGYENYNSIGRPIKLVDGGQAVNEVFTG